MTTTRSISIKYLIFITILSSSAAGASIRVDTRIQDLISPETAGESWRIMSISDGRVYEVPSSGVGLVQTLQKAQAKKLPLHLTLEGDKVTAAKDFTGEELRGYSDQLNADQDPLVTSGDLNQVQAGFSYTPSNLSSRSEADGLFSSLANLRHKSQCYQRAHFWAHQMWSRNSINSMKVFMFFTKKFIREHRYRWWFHVAPYVYVQGEEVVLDPEFLDATKTMDDWTAFFMMDTHFVKPALYSRPNCPEVANFTAYDDNQESALCYTLKLPMYYYQPTDAEALSEKGIRVEGWREWDVKHSQKAQ
jgi:hypothetical protein